MVRALVLAFVAAPVAALAQAAAAPDAPRQAAAAAPSAVLQDVDRLWEQRDEPGAMKAAGAKLEAALKDAPNEYEVLWRLSRHYFWLADDPGVEKKEKSRLGKIAWDFGDRATAANPSRVEGWNYAAAGMGNYALGIGVVTALRQGIEGKFKDRLSRAEKIEPGFQHGAIQTAWGRFWYELPWPKYSARKSRAALSDALRRNPDNVRAHVYMADLNLKEDEPGYAREDLSKAIAKEPGQYDAPEERRWQAVARRMLESL